MSRRDRRSRREFLEQSMLTTAAALAAGSASAVVAAEKKDAGRSPNQKLSVAVLGVNSRGKSHIGGFANKGDSEVTYICDPDEKVGQGQVEAVAKKQGGKKPKFAQDLRRVFDDDSVDIVSIATPNHWHALAAIWAIQAGKDVYVEKPVSHNVSEGRRIVEAARKHKKIVQTGTQSRSNPGLQQAVAFLQSGELGDVKLARGLCYKRRKSIGDSGSYPAPAHIDHNLWCGPGSDAVPTRPRYHYDWHWQFEFGNGDLGNQGIHQMDIARWGLGLDRLSDRVLAFGGRLGYRDAGDTPNTEVTIHEFGDKTLVFEVRGLETKDYKGAKVGVIWEAENGYVVAPSYNSATAFDKSGKPIKTFKGGADHYHNFVEAVQSRKREQLNADIEEGHLSSALCHTGNISYQLGSQVTPDELLSKLESLKTNDDARETFKRTRQHLTDNKVDLAETKVTLGPQLSFDAKMEVFQGNAEANALLTRDYRKPFVVPAAGAV